MPAGTIESGRIPSMDRITTRRARATGVGVAEGVEVAEGAGVLEGVCVSTGARLAMSVAIRTGCCVCVAGGVALGDVSDTPPGSWQASRIRRVRREVRSLWFLLESMVIDSF